MRKPNSRIFTTRRIGNVVEVWLGDPDGKESEFILTVHEDLIPALIAALRNS